MTEYILLYVESGVKYTKSAFSLLQGVDADCTLSITGQPQVEHVIDECSSGLPPVLDVSHELVDWQKVTGPIQESTIGHVGSQVTL